MRRRHCCLLAGIAIFFRIFSERNVSSASNMLSHRLNQVSSSARKLQKITSTKSYSSKLLVRRCNTGNTSSNVDIHFRILHNILSDTNLELLEKEMEISASKLRSNIFLVSSNNSQVLRWTHNPHETLSRQCLSTIATYAEYLAKWKAPKTTKKRPCFLFPLHYVCGIIFSSCGSCTRHN